MRALTTGLAIAISLCLVAITKAETPQPTILLNELQTGSDLSASDEFIEIINTGPNRAVLDDMFLQYKSATGDNWLTKASLEGELPSGKRLLVIKETYELDETLYRQPLTSGMAAGGGNVRLVYKLEDTEIVYDQIAWGTGDSPEGDFSIEAHDKGQSLKRLIDEDGYFVDTDHSFDDWFISDSPSPQTDFFPIEPESPEPEDETDDETLPEEGSDEPPADQTEQPPIEAPIKYPVAYISELFIDPESPLTDADDEFIELHNPSGATISLDGYVIDVGKTYSRSYTIQGLTLKPGAYLALFSSDTGLALSNSGSQARLRDPDGQVVFETASYDKAKAGEAWSLIGGHWTWSSLPSPNKANSAGGSVAGSSNSSAAASAANTAARSAVSFPSVSSDSEATTEERNTFDEIDEEPVPEINRAILAGVGSLAVLYAGYEYRSDLGNKLYKLRRYFGNWRKTRPKT